MMLDWSMGVGLTELCCCDERISPSDFGSALGRPSIALLADFKYWELTSGEDSSSFVPMC